MGRRLLAVGLALSLVVAVLLPSGHSHGGGTAVRVEASCVLCAFTGPFVTELPTTPVLQTPEPGVEGARDLPPVPERLFPQRLFHWRAPPGTGLRV